MINLLVLLGTFLESPDNLFYSSKFYAEMLCRFELANQTNLQYHDIAKPP